MLRVAVTDTTVSGKLAGYAANWIVWEFGRFGLSMIQPAEADVLFVCHAGAVDWVSMVRRDLRKNKIQVSAEMRQGKPYIIAGGCSASIPMTTLETADAVAVGEAYRLVRGIVQVCKTPSSSIGDLREMLIQSSYAIERSQIQGLKRDADRPWLLAEPTESLASPDSWVDWMIPPVKLDDGIVRILGSRGCRNRCSFCATSWEQTHRNNPHGEAVCRFVMSHSKDRVALVSNDPAAIPWFHRLAGHIEHGSFTVSKFLDPESQKDIIRRKPKIVRFGLEGISERIRSAWLKSIGNQDAVDAVLGCAEHKIIPHLFLIPGAPYEDERDWAEFKTWTAELSSRVDWGASRVKMTSFIPNPPAPLMRFLVGDAWVALHKDFKDWYFKNAVSRHLLMIHPKRIRASLIALRAEFLQVSVPVVGRLFDEGCGGTVDLAPTPEDFARMPSNALIDWPVSVSVRWKVSEHYRQKMQG